MPLTVADVAVVGSAEIEILANGSKFASDINRQIGPALKGIGRTATAAFELTAKAAAGALGAIGTTATVAVQNFAEYEQGINEVYTLLGEDPSTQTLDAIDDQVKNLASAFGIDLQTAVAGTYDAISAGISPDDTQGFKDFTETAAEFAAAGATDFATSIDLLTTGVNAFGLEASDVERVADTLFGGIRAGKTNADQLAASLFQVAPIAASTGVDIETTTAALASLTAQGVPTRVAATQIKAAFSELSKEGTIADKSFRSLAGVGFKEFLSSGGSVQEGLDLLAAGAADSGKGVADMFGQIEAGQGVLGLTGDQAGRFGENLELIGDSSGATQTAFETMSQGLTASWNQIRATVSVGLVELGESIAPFAAELAAAVSERLPAIIDGVSTFVTGAVERLVPVFGQLLDFATELFDNFDISGLFDGFSADGAGDVFTQIKDVALELAPAFAELGSALGTLTFTNITTLAPIFADLAVTILPPLAGALATIAEAFAAIIENTPEPVLTGIVAAFAGLLAFSKVSVAVGSVVKLVQALKLGAIAAKAWTVAQRALNISLLANPIGIAAVAIAALGAGLIIAYRNSETFRDAVSGLVDSFEPLLEAVKVIGSAFVDLFQGDLSGAIDGFKEGFAELGSALLGIGRELGALLWQGISAGLEALGLDGVVDFLESNFNPDRLRAIFDVFTDAFSGGEAFGSFDLQGVLGFAQDLGGFIADAFAVATTIARTSWATLNGIFTVGVATIAGIIDGIQFVWDTGVIQTIFRGAAATIRFAWEQIAGVVDFGIQVVAAAIDTARFVWDTGVLQDVFSVLADVFASAWEMIVDVVDIGVTLVSAAISTAQQVWDTGVIQAIWDVVAAQWEVAWALIVTAVEVGAAFVGNVIDTATAVWDTGVIEVIWDGVVGVWQLSWDLLSTAVTVGVEAVRTVIAGAEALWDLNVIQTIWDAVTDPWGTAWDALSGVVEEGVELVKGALEFFGIGGGESIGEQVGSIFDDIPQKFQDAWSLVAAPIEEAIEAILGALDRLPGPLKGLFGLGGDTGSTSTLADDVLGEFTQIESGVAESMEATAVSVEKGFGRMSDAAAASTQAIQAQTGAGFDEVRTHSRAVFGEIEGTVIDATGKVVEFGELTPSVDLTADDAMFNEIVAEATRSTGSFDLTEVDATLGADASPFKQVLGDADNDGLTFDNVTYESDLAGNPAAWNTAISDAVSRGQQFQASRFVATLAANISEALAGFASANRAGDSWSGRIISAIVRARDEASGVIDRIARDRTVNVRVRTGSNSFAFGDGGIISQFADGGIVDHEAIKYMASGGSLDGIARATAGGVAGSFGGQQFIMAENGGDELFLNSLSAFSRQLNLIEQFDGGSLSDALQKHYLSQAAVGLQDGGILTPNSTPVTPIATRTMSTMDRSSEIADAVKAGVLQAMQETGGQGRVVQVENVNIDAVDSVEAWAELALVDQLVQ